MKSLLLWVFKSLQRRVLLSRSIWIIISQKNFSKRLGLLSSLIFNSPRQMVERNLLPLSLFYCFRVILLSNAISTGYYRHYIYYLIALKLKHTAIRLLLITEVLLNSFTVILIWKWLFNITWKKVKSHMLISLDHFLFILIKISTFGRERMTR